MNATRPLELVGVRIREVPVLLARDNPEYAMNFFDRVHPDILVDGPRIPWNDLKRQPAPSPAKVDAALGEVIDLYTRAVQLASSADQLTVAGAPQ